MKITIKEQNILNEIHRKFSELTDLYYQLSTETREKTLKLHGEYYSINHCIRWGEIAINEIREEFKNN